MHVCAQVGSSARVCAGELEHPGASQEPTQPTQPAQPAQPSHPSQPTQPAANPPIHPARPEISRFLFIQAKTGREFPSLQMVNRDDPGFIVCSLDSPKNTEKLQGVARRTHSSTIVSKKKKYGKVRAGTHFHQKGP